jgi:hypothetical protein
MEGSERAQDIEICRQIVKEIVNYGVTQDQLLLIMQLLSYELEDTEKMQELSSILRDYIREKKFLFVDTLEDEEK